MPAPYSPIRKLHHFFFFLLYGIESAQYLPLPVVYCTKCSDKYFLANS